MHLLHPPLLEKITNIWCEGGCISVIQIFGETNHFEAHAREFALIKSVNLKNVTNVINGSPYGVMKTSWNSVEIFNFGIMLLYNAFKMCIVEKPSLFYYSDVLAFNK